MFNSLKSAFSKSYSFIAFQLLNLVVAFILLNILCVPINLLYDSKKQESHILYSGNYYREAYDKLTPEEVDGLLHEQYEMVHLIGIQYEPWVQFKYPHFEGDYINTDSYGDRMTPGHHDMVEDDATSVAVLGGSTTFGIGVSDSHTIPSYLLQQLRREHPGKSISVKNYGQGYYYSSQELVRFQRILKAGRVPDVAIFIDGLNDVGNLTRIKDTPYYTNEIRRLWNQKSGSFEKRNTALGWKYLISDWPVVRTLRTALDWFVKKYLPEKAIKNPAYTRIEGVDSDYVINTYLDNVKTLKALCDAYSVDCYHIWQPTPFYGYKKAFQNKFPFGQYAQEMWVDIFRRMEQHQEEGYLFLGNLFKDAKSKRYVDDWHYNETGNEQIAKEISQLIKPSLAR